MPKPSQVAVVIVCHNGRRHLADCLDSVLASDDRPILRRVVVVDNASTDGSSEFLAGRYPFIDRVRSEENLGFAGGNNLGWQFVREKYPATEYLALLNQDTLAAPGWLRPLADWLDARPLTAAVQAKVLLYPDKARLNTAGNQSHFLGFGFTSGYLQEDRGQFDKPRAIAFPSGAAAMVRMSAVARTGLFDPTLFLYLEDAELGWKLRQLGYDIVFIPQSVVYHKYSFQNDYRFYYYLERNRWWILATFYKTPTLLLLLPPLLAMEAGQLYFAHTHGVLCDKIRAWKFFMDRKNLATLLRRRRAVQGRRVISDRQFLAPFDAKIDFPELTSPLLRLVANPLLQAYWWAAKMLILW